MKSETIHGTVFGAPFRAHLAHEPRPGRAGCHAAGAIGFLAGRAGPARGQPTHVQAPGQDGAGAPDDDGGREEEPGSSTAAAATAPRQLHGRRLQKPKRLQDGVVRRDRVPGRR
jgi:hypothetical protein